MQCEHAGCYRERTHSPRKSCVDTVSHEFLRVTEDPSITFSPAPAGIARIHKNPRELSAVPMGPRGTSTGTHGKLRGYRNPRQSPTISETVRGPRNTPRRCMELKTCCACVSLDLPARSCLRVRPDCVASRRSRNANLPNVIYHTTIAVAKIMCCYHVP